MFTVQGRDGQDHQVAVLDLTTGQWGVLTAGSTPRYAVSGHLVYAFAGELYTAPFDLDTLKITGTAHSVLSDVLVKDTGDANFALSRTGALVYSTAADVQVREVVWVDREGREEDAGVPPGPYLQLRLSPTGDRVALATTTPYDISVWDFDRATLNRLTIDTNVNIVPVW